MEAGSRKPRKAAGVKEVAAAAGVSIGTVSHVLNSPEMVSEATRRKVEVAIRELGFVRNESARHLRAGRSRSLAYVMLDATNPYFTDVAKGIELAVEADDLTVFLCNSDNRPDREAAYLQRLQQQRVRGILITPMDPEHPMLDDLPRLGTPVVIVDRVRSGESHCSVSVDNVHGGRLAVQHLWDVGHRRIAFVGGPMAVGQVRDRLEGARGAIADLGQSPDDLVVVTTDALTVADGRAAAERIVGMASDSRPTAAFCANDLIALGLLQRCVSLGVEVPRQLAIVGYDDIDFASAAAVPLTSVRQPRGELGRRAAELLMDEANNPDHQHQQVLFEAELIARQSTMDAR